MSVLRAEYQIERASEKTIDWASELFHVRNEQNEKKCEWMNEWINEKKEKNEGKIKKKWGKNK